MEQFKRLVEKHNHVISPVVLALSFIMVFNLITPTMLLASELTPNVTSDAPEVVKPRVMFNQEVKEHILLNEKQIRQIKAQMEKLRKEGVAQPTSTNAAFTRVNALIKSLSTATTTDERVEMKKQELANLVAKLKADQEEMARVRESVKQANEILKQANQTIVKMRVSLNRVNAYAKNNPARAVKELQNFSQLSGELSKLTELTAKIEQLKTEIEKIRTSAAQPASTSTTPASTSTTQ